MYPANPQMYNQLSNRARTMYAQRSVDGRMNFAAARWLADEYAKLGGQYVDSKEQVDPRFRDYDKEEEDRIKAKKRERKKRAERRGLFLL